MLPHFPAMCVIFLFPWLRCETNVTGETCLWGCRASTPGDDWGACLETQLQKLLVMIMWRSVGLNLRCKCFSSLLWCTFSSPNYAAFVIAPPSVHVAQRSIALGTMLYLISRKRCLTERKNVVWLRCCFDLPNLKKLILMPATCHIYLHN